MTDDRGKIAVTPRYSSKPFPLYPYRLGTTVHPRRDPRGHSYGAAEPTAQPWRAEQWRTLDVWLFAIDLFNHGYWWEAHEYLEALWNAAGRSTPPARFVQGLIKVAAACLHHAAGDEQTARAQADAGLGAMREVAGGQRYMGIDVEELAVELQQARGASSNPVIALVQE